MEDSAGKKKTEVTFYLQRNEYVDGYPVVVSWRNAKGYLHRIEAPAYIKHIGSLYYLRNGILSRPEGGQPHIYDKTKLV